MKKGAADFLGKPVDLDLLLLLVRRHVDARQDARSPGRSSPRRPGSPGCPASSGARRPSPTPSDRLRRAAASDVTVLLSGESGTGKELFARALHALSPRRPGPFVAVNVAALPEGLVENELFGHERGAYTGASERRAGRFELADGGTLFLDEIGELPLGAQTKLLRVVEERTFLRVGGTVPLSVDVRLVAATNRDLGARVKAGGFREDLFYRLDVFPVRLPPLRARKEDVPELAREFARSCGESRARPRFRAEPRGASRSSSRGTGPGNVRELRNVVERAVLLASGPLIRPADVVLGAPGEPRPSRCRRWTGTLEETVERWRRAGEAARIRRALEEAAGDRARRRRGARHPAPAASSRGSAT